MSQILERSEVYSLPLDIIKKYNNEWRLGVKTHDTKWADQVTKNSKLDINQYIVQNYPELELQFVWETMTGNERMEYKFINLKTSKSSTHYVGEYHNPVYDKDLDPFYDQN